jgi:protoheme IX farnesyltransferase
MIKISGLVSQLKGIHKFTRLFLSLAIAFSAVAGFIMYAHSFNWQALCVFLGVLFLSSAASALNQFQERDLDARMQRTRNRPLPSKQMHPKTAMVIIVLLTVAGSAILFFGTNTLATSLGLFNMLWYNVVYTPLKRKTAYVIFVGALIGAVNPIIGWTAAGGYMFSPVILAIASFMFLWQVPHFWLLLLKFGKEYEAAGIPSISATSDDNRIKLLVFIWLIITIASTISLTFFHVITNFYLIAVLWLFNSFLVYFFTKTLFINKLLFKYKPAFRSLYLYQVLVLILLMINSLK